MRQLKLKARVKNKSDSRETLMIPEETLQRFRKQDSKETVTTDEPPKNLKETSQPVTTGATKTRRSPAMAGRPRSVLRKVLWGLALCIWVAIALYASQYIVSFIMVAVLGAETVVQPAWSTLYSALVYTLCLVLTILIPWKILKMKTTREELGLNGLPTWTDIGLSPIGFVLYFLASIFLLALMTSLLPGINWEQAQDVGFQNLIGAGDRILAFVSLVIVAPIAEEIIFRGWLYGKLRVRMPAWISILLVSVLFGIMHGQWNVGINVFCMSVVMCLMREITGTIWSGILLHVIKNGVAFYLLFINPMG